MSRRKTSRNKDPQRRSKRPDPQPHQTSWTATLLTAGLAVLVSAAVYAQLASPKGMLGAIRRAEDPRLSLLGEDAQRQQESGKPAWHQIEAERDKALRSHPSAGPHFAVARLLRLLLDAHRDRQSAQDLIGIARKQAAADPDNAIARLAHATIFDLREDSRGQLVDTRPLTSAPNAKSPVDRFKVMRSIVEADPPVTRATLYNAEFTNTWHNVLRRYIDRPDVAVSLATSSPHYLITDHYAVLPIMQRHLVHLANELRARGQQGPADTCIGWIADLTLGLIDAEPDAGTRLLCVNILAESFKNLSQNRGAGSVSPNELSPISSSDKHPDAIRHLEQLRLDFHARTKAAPIDLCDPSLFPRPAIDAAAYNAAFHRLVFAGGLGLIALGAAALFVIACLAALVITILPPAKDRSPNTRGTGVSPRCPPPRRRRPEGLETSPEPPADPEKRCPIYARLAITLLPAVAVALIIIAKLAAHGIYSTAWAFTVAVSVFTAGALLAIVLAGVVTVTNNKNLSRNHDPGVSPVSHHGPGAPATGRWGIGSRPTQRRLALSVLVAGVTILLAAVPPSIITQTYRSLDLAVGVVWIIILVPIVLVITATLISPARLRTIAAAAAMVWCLNVAVAFVAYQCHRSADRHYQQTVVAGRLDEITARLGPDWQQEYLAPARKIFADIPK